MIRILMADDHALVLRGLKQLLAMAGDIEVVAEASNGQQVLERIRGGTFDMILLDMHMPGLHGVDLIARIRLQAPDCPILVLSMCNEAVVARAMIRAGAAGYLTKDCSPDVLVKAVRATAAGQRFVDPGLDAHSAWAGGRAAPLRTAAAAAFVPAPPAP